MAPNDMELHTSLKCTAEYTIWPSDEQCLTQLVAVTVSKRTADILLPLENPLHSHHLQFFVPAACRQCCHQQNSDICHSQQCIQVTTNSKSGTIQRDSVEADLSSRKTAYTPVFHTAPNLAMDNRVPVTPAVYECWTATLRVRKGTIHHTFFPVGCEL